MLIESFFLKSVGEWNSMRSGHSLAFQEFEEIRSNVKISTLNKNDDEVIQLLEDNSISRNEVKIPFLIKWESKSDWNEENQKENSSGESILIPIEISEKEGKIIRSNGYTESMQVVSLFKLLDDGTLVISTDYNHISTEERIWFVSNNLRIRSSVTRSINSLAIFQTSYASEIRNICNI